ncbi:hypothetical protein [Pseudorhodoplanes sp.]|uniref:hypothetical protein n=1 Tax=Pseudorhodoplanes sp. TaxID=1934341 RepID=UPI003918CC11
MTVDCSTDVTAILRRRPAAHRLTYGAFIQGNFWADDRTFVLPLKPMGFRHAVQYAAQYHELVDGSIRETKILDLLATQGIEALPVIAFVYFANTSDEPQAIEREGRERFESAEQLVGWITGDYLNEFAYLSATSSQYFLRMVPPHSRRRLLLGPGNIGPALANNINKLRELTALDDRFAFAPSLYRDALHERNLLFKAARLFGVLEALAYALKADGVGSRKAVRKMLGLESGALGEISDGGRKIRFDRIELSGRLRDKLFHGAPFRRNDLSEEWRDSFDILSDFPEHLVSSLMSDCELEFARWGNGASAARKAADEHRCRDKELD